jgi:hypothetical protein
LILELLLAVSRVVKMECNLLLLGHNFYVTEHFYAKFSLASFFTEKRFDALFKGEKELLLSENIVDHQNLLVRVDSNKELVHQEKYFP